jgi:uncharacterized SAM-binding protein YcdF (DUF218 family)
VKSILSFIILFLIFGFVGLVFLLGFWLSPQNKLIKSEAIVVISGGETVARTNEGIKVFNEGFAPYLIFSGAARDSDISNAAAMKKIAIASGIPHEKIILEEKSKDTYENALFVKDILESRNIKNIILVTSPYHQRRASITFSHVLGDSYNIINHSAVDSTWRKSGWWKNPGSVELTLQELYRIVYIKLTGQFS